MAVDECSAGGDDLWWSVTMFSFTNELLAGSGTPDDLLASVSASGLTRWVEIDSPQHFRSYPSLDDAELARTRQILDDHGIGLTWLGAYVDRFLVADHHLSVAECVDQLSWQIRAAARLGARGVRVGLNLVAAPVISGVVPLLESTGMVLVEEVQGVATPASAALHDRLGFIESLHTDRVKVLFDTSLCMSELPASYLDALERRGAGDILGPLTAGWADPAADLSEILGPEIARTRSPALRSLLLTAVTRFGRTTIADWGWLLPQVAGVHLKFWDLDDSRGAITGPTQELRTALDTIGYRGPFCSEWGGHEWFPAGLDALTVTEGHRTLIDRTHPASRV